MSPEAFSHYACWAFRWTLIIWGGCLLAAIVAGYVLAALSGAGESGSGEEIAANDEREEGHK